MNILYLSPIGEIGGAERVLLDLMASLRSAYPRWQLGLVAGSDGPLLEQARALGVSASVLPLPAAIAAMGDAAAGGPAGARVASPALALRMLIHLPGTLAYIRRLRRAIVAASPTLVHSNGLKTHLLAARAAPRTVPIIWHLHDYVGARPLMSMLLRAHLRRCRVIIANSNSVARDARTVFRRTPVSTIYNAVDLERFSPDGDVLDLDAMAGMPPLPEGGVRVGLIATMALWKGHLAFLKALATLPPSPVRGYVIGGPLYETSHSQWRVEELRDFAAQLGLGDRVGFTGFVADSAAAIRALDIVVHASTEPEPFGLVIAEAMACGRPVITSATGGAAELIDDHVNALAYPAGDSAALGKLITRLAEDSHLRLQLGLEAHDAAQRRFNRARLAHDIGPIYVELERAAAS